MGQKHGKSKSKAEDEEWREIKRRFSDAEIKRWHTEFQRHCQKSKVKRGNEYLRVEDFVQVYNQVYPGDSSDYVHHLLRTFDVDGNGQIDFREFMMGLSVSGSDDIEKALRWAFDVYDVKQNGVITKPEMAEIVTAVYKMLDLTDIPADYATPDMVADQMFKQMDKDQSEALSWEEFRDGVMKDPFLIQLLQYKPPSKQRVAQEERPETPEIYY